MDGVLGFFIWRTGTMSDLIVSEGGSSALSLHRAATDAASVCKQIVTATAQTIQGRKYVRCEGWQAISNAFGCVASAMDVRRVDGGFRATGQVRRMADGMVVAEAEGFVGDDEGTWAKRPEFARRAMAQTRAISRACRSAFAFVVVMMEAGLETCPAEEMVGIENDRGPIEYRPKPAPEGLERRAPRKTVVELVEKQAAQAAAPAANDAFPKALAAIGAATTLDDCDEIRRKIATSQKAGRLTADEERDLVSMIQAKAEAIIAAEGVET
jgi:hypothetical protein